MLIKRVELENIKSYDRAEFEFERGTTVITGENGAGKTTLIEAVAWTLFDHLGYKKRDFVRRGSEKGTVSVTFRSGLDERDYVVTRDTGTAYYVYDPAANFRIAEKREEVLKFLWQHLGVEAGTDLETLFKHAIGVPQGTLTAIFLAAAAERKRTFDTLLKVEEYRRGAEGLLETVRYLDHAIKEVELRIERGEAEVGRIGKIEGERADARAKADAARNEIEELERRIGEYREVVGAFDANEATVSEAAAKRDEVRSKLERAELVRAQAEREFAIAEAALAVIAEVKKDAEAHTQAAGEIAKLEQERELWQRCRNEASQIELAAAAARAEQTRFLSETERLDKARTTIQTLRPLAAKQAELEHDAAGMRERLVKAQALRERIDRVDAQMSKLREAYRTKADERKVLTERSAAAGDLGRLEAQDSSLVNEIAKLNATLEHDEAFKREIRNGLCPVLSEKCLNLKNGQTLEGFLSDQFDDLRSRIGQLEKERSLVLPAITASREAASLASIIQATETRLAEIGEEGKKLADEREEIARQLAADFSEGSLDITALERDLAALDNPKARIVVLESELGREAAIRDGLGRAEAEIARLAARSGDIAKDLERFDGLDAKLSEAAARRDRTAEAYRRFVANQAAAEDVHQRRERRSDAVNDASRLAEDLRLLESRHAEAAGNYDRERHQEAKRQLTEYETREAVAKAMLGSYEQIAQRLSAELQALEQAQLALRSEHAERSRLEQVRETARFIRDTLKEAAPRVAKNYVWHVSQEANQLFRDISGNAERMLKWDDDYGIFLEERGYERPFASLSGGEQMAAAISVRLALLQQLSDIRIAFFDEPTTNMDAERRENLAQQIGQIRHFDQLFVISHDDTFEAYVENEIRIERES